MKELIEKYRVAIVLIIILILTVGGIVTLYYFNNKKISEQVIIWNGPGGEYKIDIVNKNGFKTYTTYVDIRGQRYGSPLRHSP
jgi:predicted ThiF/HesA family dinucleotide-utilizing enzyme